MWVAAMACTDIPNPLLQRSCTRLLPNTAQPSGALAAVPLYQPPPQAGLLAPRTASQSHRVMLGRERLPELRPKKPLNDCSQAAKAKTSGCYTRSCA